MTGLHALWLPMVLSAVAIFFASSLIHMVLPWHKNDYVRVPKQDDVMAALRAYNIAPGDYMMPKPDSMNDMKSAEFKAKADAGPRIVMTVMANGFTNMGPLLATWFVYALVISLFAGYVASRALHPGADYLHVFRFAGVTAFAGYSLALPQASIWFGKSWRTTIMAMFDGLIYACLTAGIYGWLWPK